MMLVSLMILACGEPDPVCDDGFDLHDDGMCYEVGGDDTTVPTTGDSVYDAWLASQAPCEADGGDGRLDLVGCVEGVCIGDGYDDWVAVFGEPDCGFSCDWPNGVGASFSGGASGTAEYVTIDVPYDGTTAGGAGLGASTRCFVDELGTPGAVQFEPGGSVLGDQATWYDPAFVSASDGGFSGSADGLVDRLFLAGGGG
jgi:hypothetical protein